MRTTSQCIADVTGHSMTIALFEANQNLTQGICEQSTNDQLIPSGVSTDSSILSNVNLDNTAQDTSPQSTQTTSNNEQINAELLESFVVPIDQFDLNDFPLSQQPGKSDISGKIHIKREHLDEQSDNGQQMDKDDADTNAHNVTVNIKTESMDCDFVMAKEKDDHDNYCDRFVVERDLVGDDEEQVDKDGYVKRSRSEELDDKGGLIGGVANYEVVDGRYEVIQQDVDCGQLSYSLSQDIQIASNQTALKKQIVNDFTHHNGTKRSQPQSNLTVKRLKKTIQNDAKEEGEDSPNGVQHEKRIKVVQLNCTESECNVKLTSLYHLYDHLLTTHGLRPFRCFSMNCTSRFLRRSHLRTHLKLHHSQSTQFACPVCHKEFDSQNKTYRHWYYIHQNGQFKCNLGNDCTEVSATRSKLANHQQKEHHSELKHFHCTHPGCCASFAFKGLLKRHELIHLNSRPFHCNWDQCSHSTNQLASLIVHIRVRHFGLPATVKEQKAKNIVDGRDPNEYVRLVEQVNAQ